ncbi:hypothetical protein SynBIOSE41_01345 [Synechococcus sp. BIOS-E4-1]|nr:hypothetical protein SynBIOSE41_01345 [Synechococcus sp. BIOS-E4-1]
MSVCGSVQSLSLLKCSMSLEGVFAAVAAVVCHLFLFKSLLIRYVVLSG